MKQIHKLRSVHVLAVIIACSNLVILSPDYSNWAIAKSGKVKRVPDKAEIPNQNNIDSSNKDENADWRKASRLSHQLLLEQKFAQAETILAKVLPQARKGGANSFWLSIFLLKYGIALSCQKKYTQALPILEEALKSMQRQPATAKQERAIYQIITYQSLVYNRLNQFAKAEERARLGIAYSIAFPQVADNSDRKKTYYLLKLALDGQKEAEEANVIAEIIDTV